MGAQQGSFSPGDIQTDRFGEETSRFGEDEREGSSGPDARPTAHTENLGSIARHLQVVQEALRHLNPRTADVLSTSHDEEVPCDSTTTSRGSWSLGNTCD